MEKIKRLPESELEVMLIIWRQGEAIHTGEILQKLNEKKTCNLQMVQSTLNRLLGKDFIHCNKIGRLNYYTPLMDEVKYREQETETFIEQMYHNSPAKLITALLSKRSMSEADIEEIRLMLEKGGE
jgi:predicted transcriptional regulator